MELKTVGEIIGAYNGGKIGRDTARSLLRGIGEDPDDFFGSLVETAAGLAGAMIGGSILEGLLADHFGDDD